VVDSFPLSSTGLSLERAWLPGPGRFLDYTKNDDWACGMLLHSMLCGPAATSPFSCGDDPRQFRDEHYTHPELGGGGFAPVFGEVCAGARCPAAWAPGASVTASGEKSTVFGMGQCSC
jgi:hypothetical protein